MAKMSTRRKLAIATWGSPREGNIYGKMTLDATAAIAHLERLSRETGEHITMTHFVGKVMAEVLANSSGLNGFLRFGTYHQHPTADVSFLVNIGKGTDLSNVISNVGVFGLDEGYMPPTPFAHIPIHLLIGAIREQPAVVDGQVVARKVITLSATVDHRFIDGYEAGLLAQTPRDCFANPERFGA